MSRTSTLMKTTIDLDEAKLKSVMKLTGIKTRKGAVDYALTEAERRARMNHLLATKWDARALREAVDVGYDYRALRGRDRSLPRP
jgi:Arc/MetJ family transcription regulator